MATLDRPGRGGPVGVVVGCGTISRDSYLRNLTAFPDLRVLFCADIDLKHAAKQAASYDVPESGTPQEALRHPEVEIVVNLTIPSAHADVTSAALAAGKSVWTEKPPRSPSTLPQGGACWPKRTRPGCSSAAPDTVLGAGLQTARRLMAEGVIGVQTALAMMQSPGPELWHPDPEFLFQPGAGPVFDIGPYYLSWLATIFGPAERVAAVGRRSRDTRVIAKGPARSSGSGCPPTTPR